MPRIYDNEKRKIYFKSDYKSDKVNYTSNNKFIPIGVIIAYDSNILRPYIITLVYIGPKSKYNTIS